MSRFVHLKTCLCNTFQLAGVEVISHFTHANCIDSNLVLNWHNFRPPLSIDCISTFFGDILLVFASHIKFWILLLISLIAGSGTSIRLA